jgi:hypothetical protein
MGRVVGMDEWVVWWGWTNESCGEEGLGYELWISALFELWVCTYINEQLTKCGITLGGGLP